jgi:hypothetical protein
MSNMEKGQKSLQSLADNLLSDIECGDAWPAELEDDIGDFSGYSVESLRSRFEDFVVDMRDYGEPDQGEWEKYLGSIPASRHHALIQNPSEVTRHDLQLWALSGGDDAYDSFCFAAGVPLTNDPNGPIAVIGTTGSVHEYCLFLVADSRRAAEEMWSEGWIE